MEASFTTSCTAGAQFTARTAATSDNGTAKTAEVLS
jgi:hypothetical protein